MISVIAKMLMDLNKILNYVEYILYLCLLQEIDFKGVQCKWKNFSYQKSL